MATTIGSAPSGQNTAPDGSEKIPISGSKYLLLSTAGNYLHGVALGFLSALMAPTVGLANAQGDAVGEIEYGGTAPSGTDRTAAIQAAIDALAASSTVGATLVWDGAWGISACLLIPSNFTILAPNKQCGAILRTNSNSSMFRNSGCLTADASSNRQNTWGKINPTPGSDQKYRILDAAFFANTNIAVIGGLWNGNRDNQSGAIFDTNGGAHSNFQFYGVDGLRLEGFTAMSSQTFNIHLGNVRHVVANDLILDQSPAVGLAVGNWQCEGPAQYIECYNFITHNSIDDNVAFNADDGNNTVGQASYGASFSCGTNWSCSGAITDVLLDGLAMFRGVADETQGGCLRLLSAVALMDNITIKRVSGATIDHGISIGSYQGLTLVTGTGNFGRIRLEDITASFSSPGYTESMIDIEGHIRTLEIIGRKCEPIPAQQDITVKINGAVDDFVIDAEYYAYAGSTNNAVPAILIKQSGVVYCLTGRVSSIRDTGFTTAVAAPIIQVNGASAQLHYCDLSVAMEGATNVVDIVDGSTLGTIILRGFQANSDANNSPLKIATGKTLTNFVDDFLVYDRSKGAVDGSGTVTHQGLAAFVG